MNLTENINQALENIYISPLELCNLNCRACYTNKTKNILSNQQIFDFIENYNNSLKKRKLSLKSILICGGEVFTLKDFPLLVNNLIEKNIFITIITNGTINRLSEIKNPQNCQLLVSIDGPKEIHDNNRGQGNFDKSMAFIKYAKEFGFPTEIMFLITKDSYPFKDSLNIFNLPKTYLSDRKMSLSKERLLDIKNNYKTFPSKNFGCFQLSLQSTGIITGCCESSLKLGTINDNPDIYIDNFIKSLNKCSGCQKCNGCSDPDYFCGYKTELNLTSCQDVVKSLK